jgi:hypothetical protein
VTKVDLTVRGDVRRLRLAKGDRVVVTIAAVLSPAMLALTRQQLEEMFPKNEVLILSAGARLNVVEGKGA